MKIAACIILFLIPLFVCSQTDQPISTDRFHYGFNLGVNRTNLLHDGEYYSQATVSNTLGFNLGILAAYKCLDFLFISPKAELSVSGGNIIVEETPGNKLWYEARPITLDLMTHFMMVASRHSLKPYFLVGPNFKVPVSVLNFQEGSEHHSNDVAIDFGFGIHKNFKQFQLAPELRYSLGLVDINPLTSNESIYFHKISVVFNFISVQKKS